MSFDEANYKNLSQVLRSNIFPYVEQPWSSSARTTHASLKAAAYTGKVNGLSKDWLGKWHENEVHRRNIMQGYENRHSERMSAAASDRIDLPNIEQQDKKKIQQKHPSLGSRQKKREPLPSIKNKKNTTKENNTGNKNVMLKLPKLSEAGELQIATDIEQDARQNMQTADNENKQTDTLPTVTQKDFLLQNNKIIESSGESIDQENTNNVEMSDNDQNDIKEHHNRDDREQSEDSNMIIKEDIENNREIIIESVDSDSITLPAENTSNNGQENENEGAATKE